MTLIDGLWTDNHGPLQRYRAETDSIETVSLAAYDFGMDRAGLGRSVLLDFQVPTQRAAALLPNRLEGSPNPRRSPIHRR